MVRIKRYRYLGTVGTVIMAFGLWLLSQITVTSSQTEVVRDLVLVGLGVGVGMPLYLNATQSAVDVKYLGVVSSQIQFWRNIGSTVGVALLGAVLSHELPTKINEAIGSLNLPPQAAAAFGSGAANPQALFDPAAIAAAKAQLPTQLAPLFDQVLLAIRSALAAATHDVFIYAAIAAALASVVSLFLQEVPLRGRNERAPRAQTENETEKEPVAAFGG
jgi:Flp pilus assembly protein protease CpaA